MQCPKCSSENTQRLEQIYESGTQQIRTTSNTVGGGGGFGGGGVTTTSGIQQTGSAKKAAPPAKKSYAGAIILSVISFPVIFNPSATYILVAGAFMVLAVWLWRRASDYNTNVWPGLKKYGSNHGCVINAGTFINTLLVDASILGVSKNSL